MCGGNQVLGFRPVYCIYTTAAARAGPQYKSKFWWGYREGRVGEETEKGLVFTNGKVCVCVCKYQWWDL